MCKLCNKIKELRELDAKQYKHIIEAWRRRDVFARKLITEAEKAIKQLSTMKIGLTIDGKKVADLEGSCSGTKKILKDMNTFLSSDWVDLPKETTKGKKNV